MDIDLSAQDDEMIRGILQEYSRRLDQPSGVRERLLEIALACSGDAGQAGVSQATWGVIYIFGIGCIPFKQA